MFQLSIRQSGAEEIRTAMNRLLYAIDDLSPAWPAVEQEFHEIEYQQFSTEGGSGEAPEWHGLSEQYAKWKDVHFPGTKILERTGRLWSSLATRSADSIYEASPTRLVLGSTVPYSVYHQMTGRAKWWRPPISFTNEQAAQITAVLNRYLFQAANDAFRDTQKVA